MPRRVALLFVRAYQLVISPHFPSSCNFEPTCSDYAIQALERYGAFRGSILAAHRIFRCHPWGSHGYDPPLWYSERLSEPQGEGGAVQESGEELTQ